MPRQSYQGILSLSKDAIAPAFRALGCTLSSLIGMRIKHTHPWNVSPEEAARIQNELRSRVKIEDDLGEVHTVAGVDVGISQSEGTATGGVVVLSFPALDMIEMTTATRPVEFPYIPGLLAFREMPAILAAFELLVSKPDLLIVDGQGLAHPRRFGIACHLGVALGLPSIGCGKKRLVGAYEEPGPQAGDSSPLMADTERIGSVLRTKANVKPIFVSPGHRVGFESAEKLVMRCTRSYRLPEPIRLAHGLVARTLPESFSLAG